MNIEGISFKVIAMTIKPLVFFRSKGKGREE